METVVEAPAQVNDYEKFRKPIQGIINFTDTIDAVYREKCFEVLLNHYLFSGSETKKPASMQENKTEAPEVKEGPYYPFDLQTFLQHNSISEAVINKLFLREKGSVQPIYKITETSRAVAQIQVALLTAFENALLTPGGALEFSMKAVRQRCVEYRVYNGFDFMFYFKNRAGLFSNLDCEVVRLTPVGKTELAKLMVTLTNQ